MIRRRTRLRPNTECTRQEQIRTLRTLILVVLCVKSLLRIFPWVLPPFLQSQDCRCYAAGLGCNQISSLPTRETQSLLRLTVAVLFHSLSSLILLPLTPLALTVHNPSKLIIEKAEQRFQSSQNPFTLSQRSSPSPSSPLSR